jgi:hypothetical protein
MVEILPSKLNVPSSNSTCQKEEEDEQNREREREKKEKERKENLLLQVLVLFKSSERRQGKMAEY